MLKQNLMSSLFWYVLFDVQTSKTKHGTYIFIFISNLPSSCVVYNDAIVYGESVSWQTSNVPSTDLYWFTKSFAEWKVRRAGNTSSLDQKQNRKKNNNKYINKIENNLKNTIILKLIHRQFNRAVGKATRFL